jgi:hypothetical protein
MTYNVYRGDSPAKAAIDYMFYSEAPEIDPVEQQKQWMALFGIPVAKGASEQKQ